jgi:hypothetical protein
VDFEPGFGALEFWNGQKHFTRDLLLLHGYDYSQSPPLRTGDEQTDDEFRPMMVWVTDSAGGAPHGSTGKWLWVDKLAKPLTREDIDAKAEIKIDLVFNPENFGQAYETQSCRDQNWVQICDPINNVVIDMPYVRMNPVPRKTGEKTRKETYLMDYDVNSKLRIELYYNDHDPEAGVQGVDTAIVYGPSATTPNNNVIASNFVAQIGSVRSNDASVTLMDYQHTPNLQGLRRRQNGSATIHCLFTGAICPTPGGTVTRPYTYQGDTVVSTD